MTRFASLALALLAVAFVGCSESPTVPTTTATPPVDTEPVVFDSGETVEMEIPGMHCPYGCYPTVESTLASQPGVESVRLVDPEDAEDGSIDDRRVLIVLNDKFNATAASTALAEAGFTPASTQQAKLEVTTGETDSADAEAADTGDDAAEDAPAVEEVTDELEEA